MFSANVFEPFGFTDKKLLKDFSTPSVIWGIDGDWNVNILQNDFEFYPTDHCGVIRVICQNIIEPKYLAWLLYKEGLKSKFSRSYRASIDRVSQLSLVVPDYNIQQTTIKEIYKLENQINTLQEKLSALESKKFDIVSKFLNS